MCALEGNSTEQDVYRCEAYSSLNDECMDYSKQNNMGWNFNWRSATNCRNAYLITYTPKVPQGSWTISLGNIMLLGAEFRQTGVSIPKTSLLPQIICFGTTSIANGRYVFQKFPFCSASQHEGCSRFHIWNLLSFLKFVVWCTERYERSQTLYSIFSCALLVILFYQYIQKVLF